MVSGSLPILCPAETLAADGSWRTFLWLEAQVTYLMNVYSVVKEQAREICPSSGRSRERQKYKARRKILKNFFIRPPFRFFQSDRKQKKAQLPSNGNWASEYKNGINRNKIPQKISNQNKDTGRSIQGEK